MTGARSADGSPAAGRHPGTFGCAADLVPPRPTLPKLRAIARGCKECDLWLTGTQTVFGEGPAKARVMFVGEQPGDKEDLAGRPFVGPSGALLDAALVAAGIDRDEVYVTNVVKHFKWEQRGEKSARRIHRKPNSAEIAACRGWLDAEIAVVRPRAIVCLGATAAQSLLGRQFRITRDHGKRMRTELADAVFATSHPSSVLRMPDAESRARARRDFFSDVRKIARFLAD